MISDPSTVVEYLRDRGHVLIETSNAKNKYRCACPSCSSDSFSISANQNQFKCFACDFKGAGVGAARKLLGDVANTGDTSPAVALAVKHQKELAAKNKKTKQIAKANGKNQWQGATVRELCEAKGIDYDYATSTLGWQDTRYGRKHTPAVAMPYYGDDGEQIDTRYRVGISQGTRVVSRKGSSIMPYGLQNLRQCRAGNYIICEEGETDWATLDSLGYNALGIPGVMSFKPEWTIYLKGIKTVYVWQESGGKPDRKGRTPGQQMVHRISSYRGQVWVLEAPPEGKDPCELRQKLGDAAFMAMLDQMMLDAKPYDALALEAEARQGANPKPKPDTNQDTDTDQPTIATPGQPITQAWEIGTAFDKTARYHGIIAKGIRTAATIHKPLNLTTIIHNFRKLWKEENNKNREFYPLDPEGVKLCDSDTFMDNVNLMTSEERMVELVAGSLGKEDMAGEPVAAYAAICDCGRENAMTCDTHGAAWGGTHKCYLPFDPNCGTQASSQAARVKLPHLEGTANYYHVVFEDAIPLPDNIEKWSGVLSARLDKWQKIIAKASTWKASKHQIYCRSHSTYYQQRPDTGKFIAITHWKLMFHEAEEGALSKVVDRIASHMAVVVVDERRWQEGLPATLQIVDDFMTHFIGIDPAISFEDQCQIFLGHYVATKGRHVFQAFGLLREKMAELPEPEPQICPVPGCGQKLHEVLVPRMQSVSGAIIVSDGGGKMRYQLGGE